MDNCALPLPSSRPGTAHEGGKGSVVPREAVAVPEEQTPPRTEEMRYKDSHKYLVAGCLQVMSQ